MTVVLGLGNEGPEFRLTRHNVGFMVADLIAERCGGEFAARGELGRLAWSVETDFGGRRVVLAKPRTLMNGSGRAAAALRRRHGAEPGDFIVVYDDADLAFGRVRVRPEGGAGGHNGIRSLVDLLGSSSFPRVKLGIRGEERNASDLREYVLAKFRPEERTGLDRLISLGADAVEAVLRDGILAAQREFNGPAA